MRLIKNGPDVPDQLIQEHEEGRVIFFCGAGISYRAGLPGFEGLVSRLFESFGENPNPNEQDAINEKRYDAAINLLERRIDDRNTVREHIREILTPEDLSKPSTTDTHKSLLTLSKAENGHLRLVTTNFDRIFCKIAPSGLPFFAAPQLPIPKKSRWHGLVYLHGLLPEEIDPLLLNNIVVSSGDFGLAYLTERWASRFVTEMFRNYTVCFVGYSIGDPVLRYILDALSADRMLGENTPKAFAFGEFETGQKDREQREWEAKGVTPILYSKYKDHYYFHKTLREWANVYSYGLTGKRSIITREAASLPSRVEGDGHIDRVLWALSDRTGHSAAAFAELDPAPPVEWLSVLLEKQLSKNDLPRFQITPSDSPEDSKPFSFLNRPTPHLFGPWMTLVGPQYSIRGAARLDNVMFQFARWVIRHLDKPEVLRWVISNDCVLHPQFRDLILRELKTGTYSRPLTTVWMLICGGFTFNSQYEHGFYDWVETFEKFGWSNLVKADFLNYLRPKVVFRPPFRWGLLQESDVLEEELKDEPPIREYADWEITVQGGEHIRINLEKIRNHPDWTTISIELLYEFSSLLKDTIDLMSELDGAVERSDLSYSYHPSIEDHHQNNNYQTWTVLIEFCRDTWLLATSIVPHIAKIEFERWRHIRYPIFRRLVLFAVANSSIVSDNEALEILLEEGAWWLWSVETEREMFRLLSKLAPKLRNDQLEKLSNSIISGPPRSMFRDELSSAEWKRMSDHMIWLRLEKCKSFGATMIKDAEMMRKSLTDQHPEWQLRPDDRDEFPTWMESGDSFDWKTKVNLPRERESLATALVSRPVSDLRYGDDWRSICQHDYKRAITVLILLSKKDKWPADVWREALQVLSEEKLIYQSWRWLGMPLLRAPSELLEGIGHSYSWWLQAVAKVLPSKSQQCWFSHIDRALENNYSDEGSFRNDSVSRAINHPVGQVTEGLLRWWYRGKPQAGERLQDPLKARLNRLTEVSKSEFTHGRVIMASHLYSFFLVDPEWTNSTLLPFFDWNAGNGEVSGIWEGYLRSPRISPDLIEAMKVPFLDTASHYNELGYNSGRFVDLLTIAALNYSEHFTTNELREAFNSFPPEGLAHAASMMVRALSEADDRNEEYWLNRIKPTISKMWPKSADKRTTQETRSLSTLCINAGEDFPRAVKLLKPLFLRSTDYFLPLKELLQSKLGIRFPSETLEFLDAIIQDDGYMPVENLGKCLGQIGDSKPELKTRFEFQRLSRIVELN